ncbi:uncharacterized protein ACNS7B_013090 isoform 1-T2 [Menidia menidia]
MEEGQDFSLDGKPVVSEVNLRDEYFWKLVSDFVGPQSGEGLDLDPSACRNRVLIQVGLLREDNNFPWLAIVGWLKKIFPAHQSADFRRLIERGVATTLSLRGPARLGFLDSQVNFNFVGPICDSIGVERQHLLELRDFSERAQSIEVTNGLILELVNFVNREKISPIVIVTWLRNFNPEFCKKGDIQTAYKHLKGRIKKLRVHFLNYETRSHRRNTAMETLLQTPFELVKKKTPKFFVRKRPRRDDAGSCGRESESPEAESRTASGGADSEEEEEEMGGVGEPLTLLDMAMLSVQKLSSVYGGKTTACRQVSLDLLRNQYALTCREHPAMLAFEQQLGAARHAGAQLLPPVRFLHQNACFLVDVHDALERLVAGFEGEVIRLRGEKLGRDRLPHFQGFVSLQESATQRYVLMAAELLGPRAPGRQSFRRHWLEFCQEKGNPSRLASSRSNRVAGFFEAAAGLTHHHREVGLFLSDLQSMAADGCPNAVLESVAADAGDGAIQSFVCVLAVVHCKVLGPYWQLLSGGGEYALFSRRLLGLYQRFLDWSKDPSTLLEPEDATDVFQQPPLQEQRFQGVFEYCGQWHTNRDLIRACLKRAVKAIAAVTQQHLGDFLPGGAFSGTPPGDASQKLAGCTFSVLMAEYPFGHASPYKMADGSPGKKLSDSSQEDESASDSSGSSSEESSSQPAKKSPQTKKARRVCREEREDIMDRDYIVATVTRNGGPCKTRQDVDKMMLRLEGKSRWEKREGVRCELLYQKMVLGNASPHLSGELFSSSQMAIKLKFALPRVKPGYSLVLAPKKSTAKAAAAAAAAAAAVAAAEVAAAEPPADADPKT